MLREAIKYSLKVWLTSVLVSPIIYFIIDFYQQTGRHYAMVDSIEWALPFYLLFVIIEAILSAVIWVVFAAMIGITLELVRVEQWLKPIMCLWGVSLNIGTFLLFARPRLNDPSDMGFILMVSNTAIVGWSCWFYNLKAKKTIEHEL